MGKTIKLLNEIEQLQRAYWNEEQNINAQQTTVTEKFKEYKKIKNKQNGLLSKQSQLKTEILNKIKEYKGE